MTSNIPEVQNLFGELAKKIAITGADLTPSLIGRSLYGLQGELLTFCVFLSDGVVTIVSLSLTILGISSEVSIFADVSPLAGVYGDTDEAQFLLSALWDKIKVVKTQMPLSSIAMGLEGIALLKDPLGNNIRQYLYAQCLNLGTEYVQGKFLIFFAFFVFLDLTDYF